MNAYIVINYSRLGAYYIFFPNYRVGTYIRGSALNRIIPVVKILKSFKTINFFTFFLCKQKINVKR